MTSSWQITLSTIIGLLSAVGCGADSNINQIWGYDQSADSLMLEARAAYDQGDYEEARIKARKVYDTTSSNEEAAILLGYIHLSEGGIDPFRLAREMVCLTKPDLSECSAAATIGANLQLKADGEGTGAEEANSASSTLKQLSTLLSLSEEDFDRLQSQDPGRAFNPTSDLFAGLKILVPAKVDDQLRADIPTLDNINKAINYICPFVNTDVRNASGRQCVPSPYDRKLEAKSHFLWAFTHLTEALAFQSVLLYSGTESSSTKSNFQTAVDRIDNKDFKGANAFAGFAEQVKDLKSATDLVFDVADDDSMLAATLNDLQAVNAAFGALAGLPDAMTKKISDAMSNISDLSNRFGGDQENGSVKALKGQMTEKFGKVVGTKIDAAIAKKFPGQSINSESDIDNLALSNEEKAKAKEQYRTMCDTYDTLMVGVPPEQQNPPKACTAR